MESENIEVKGSMPGYHTQEFRPQQDMPLKAPLKSVPNDSWLGTGFYFWRDIEYAHYWGVDCKMKYGSYDIYKADLRIEKVLDTAFNEEGYEFFKAKIEEAVKYLVYMKRVVDLTSLHAFLAEKFWKPLGIEGIIYCDTPTNSNGRTHSQVPKLFYKKRVQIVIFDLKNVLNFKLFLEDQKK